MIKYDKLWITMKKKGITQYALYTKYKISRSLLQRLRNNQSITTHNLNLLCNILNCNIEDICEFIKDENFDEMYK